MLIRMPPPHAVRSSDITPERVYQDRRRFITQLGLGAAALLTGCGKPDAAGGAASKDVAAPLQDLVISKRSALAGEETVTPFADASTYNNYYEFGTDKSEPAKNAHTLRTRPWIVTVEGECEAPGQIGIEDLVNPKTLEERIYRFRCVEAWSMVVPWVGIPLGDFLARFKPTLRAKYVAFETLSDPQQMPLARYAGFDLPYTEGLRIDEAMHPLAFLAVGMYGRTLPNQNGAPLRLVTPWKYGYKSIKSIVKVRFVENEPTTTWKSLAASEYGFYSNVNPAVSHPRWSQKTERRLGELFKHETLLYNGYPEVASLYAGMDPVKFH
ncbi:MAG: protein-methionine-sulfoxide reductase catalytic subunit MsrP [Panacagrimonas sp.]